MFESGTEVIVRTATGDERRRVVRIGEGVIYLTTDEEYHRFRNDGKEPMTLGFPTQDVRKAS